MNDIKYLFTSDCYEFLQQWNFLTHKLIHNEVKTYKFSVKKYRILHQGYFLSSATD